MGSGFSSPLGIGIINWLFHLIIIGTFDFHSAKPNPFNFFQVSLQVMNCLEEFEERHYDLMKIEKELRELHQVIHNSIHDDI